MKLILMVLMGSIQFLSMITNAQAEPLSEVQFQSAYIFEVPGGYDSLATYSDKQITNWIFYTRDDTNDGLVDTVSIRGQAPANGGLTDWWDFQFSTRGLNSNLAPGIYNNPGPYPTEEAGQSGFNADISGGGFSTAFPNAKGSFKILDFQYDYSAPGSITPNEADYRVKSFAADFYIHANFNDVDNVNVLKGHVYYNFGNDSIPQPTVPEPATLFLMSGGLAGMFLRVRKRKQS